MQNSKKNNVSIRHLRENQLEELADSLSGNSVGISDVKNLLNEASSAYAFNRELLQSSIENLDQGVSVIDGYVPFSG